ncbi:MAG: hypothetical protein JRK53_10755 [Deltaproteobacteria bacterium]|nr:hypothetical protein [Deltaproteobacteria bacterium]
MTWLLLAAFLSLAIPAMSAGREKAPTLKAAVIISRNIRPYVDAAEGVETSLRANAGADVQIFFMKNTARGGEDLAERLLKDGYDVWIAVGPDSAAFIWKQLPGDTALRVYCMVLNPEKAIGDGKDVCGISLNIDVGRQLEIISKGLPRVANPGILYDPRHNSTFVREARERAAFASIGLRELAVSSRKEIPAALKRYWREIDALWLIPDRTVISESVVQFLIKEALLRNIPVVGYNRFFYESGAALAMVFDYEELGGQTGRLALRALGGEVCRSEAPGFHAWLNRNVLNKLGMEAPEALPAPLEVGP